MGLHEQALRVRSYRMELLASNLANADTPNYKARDVDFRDILRSYHQQQPNANTLGLATSRSGHIGSHSLGGIAITPQYRVPSQPSIDGNTVTAHEEKAKLAENNLRYQATIDFLNGKIRKLKQALKGQ
ncbi:flagellar basal body rod protein FlgB [Ectothiorhodospiraceae bacterium BW-2]|nr:flagellar basal body rod protein FlgB [Ectothiorhodospiraceae bacterium BW-2]